MLTNKIQRSRIDCLIYFSLVEWGWPRLVNGKYQSPIFSDSHLGLPSRGRCWLASQHIHQTCPEEAKAYKESYRIYREANKRFAATKTKETWAKYIYWVAYNTKTAYARGFGLEELQRNYLIKYDYKSLYKRIKERNRARKEILQAFKDLKELRDQIFAKMGVPLKYRAKAL